jgi:putative transposase
MAVDFAIASQGGEVGSSADRPAMDCERDFVSRSHGLPMAADASRISQLENGVYSVLAVAQWVWKNVHDALRRMVRKAAGKKPTPSVAIVDSQSVRTAEGGEFRGYDAGKKITGRKRHIAVDTLGLICAVVVHAASWQDQDGAHLVAQALRDFPRLKVIFGDSAYGRGGFPQWVAATFGWIVQTVLRPVQAAGFVVLPKRWIVERTFAWLARYRRHSRDYEHRTETSETMIYTAMIALMSRRLTRRKCV